MLKSKLARMRGPSITQTGLEMKLSPTEEESPVMAPSTNEAPPLPYGIQAKFKSRLRLLAPVLISVILSMVGQLILKRGMSDLGPVSFTTRSIPEIIWAIATDPFIIFGMVIYAVSVLYWLVGLSRVPLSYAYPFISLSYVLILGASFFLLGEHLSLLRIGGVLVICLGVLLVAFSNPSDNANHNKGVES